MRAYVFNALKTYFHIIDDLISSFPHDKPSCENEFSVWGNGQRPSLPFLQFQVNMVGQVHDSVDSALVNIVQVVRRWKTQEASRHQRGADVALRRGKTPVANRQS